MNENNGTNRDLNGAYEQIAYMNMMCENNIENLMLLRRDIVIGRVDLWLQHYYHDNLPVYRPIPKPSNRKIRKNAGIGFWENIKSFFNENKREIVENRKKKAKENLMNDIEHQNAVIHRNYINQCNELNRIVSEMKADIESGDSEKVKAYFSYVLQSDSITIGDFTWCHSFYMEYKNDRKRLVINCFLPDRELFPNVKEWIINKEGKTVCKNYSKTEFLEKYERFIFEYLYRIVGNIFMSDDCGLVNDIVINGMFVNNEWQRIPYVIISFSMPKRFYNYENVLKLDFVCKDVISRLNEVRYIADIKSGKAPSKLLNVSVNDAVIPIESAI